jgi:hypothetical protein
MTYHSECPPDCCACRVRDALVELKDAGADVDDIIPLLMMLVGDVFNVDIGGVELREMPGKELLH